MHALQSVQDACLRIMPGCTVRMGANAWLGPPSACLRCVQGLVSCAVDMVETSGCEGGAAAQKPPQQQQQAEARALPNGNAGDHTDAAAAASATPNGAAEPAHEQPPALSIMDSNAGRKQVFSVPPSLLRCITRASFMAFAPCKMRARSVLCNSSRPARAWCGPW